MFKKLKDKISEEVGQSGINPMQQLSQFASYVSETAQNKRSNLSLASSTVPTSQAAQTFGVGSVTGEAADPAAAVDYDGSRSEAASTAGGARPRSHAKTVGDWLRHPDGHIHCQHGDYDCESEVASSVASLGTVTKEQLLTSYQRVRAKLSRQRARHAELARTCAALETECRQAREAARRREEPPQSGGKEELPDTTGRLVDQACGTETPLEPGPPEPGSPLQSAAPAGDTAEEAASTDVSRLKEKVSQLEALLIKCKDSIRLHKSKVSTLTSQRDQLTAEKDQLMAEREQLTTDKDHLVAERDQLTADKAQLSSEADRLSSETQLVTTERDQLRLEKGQLTTQLEQLRAQEASARDAAAADSQQLQRQLAELRQQLQLKESQAQRLVLESAKTQKRISDLEKQAAASSTLASEETQRLSGQLQDQQRQAEQDKLALMEELSQCKGELASSQSQLEAAEQRAGAQEQSLEEARKELEAARGELERSRKVEQEQAPPEGEQPADQPSHQVALLREQLAALEAEAAQLRQDAAEAAQRRDTAEADSAALRDRHSEEMATLRRELEAENEVRLSAQTEQHRKEMAAMQASEAGRQAERDRWQAERDRWQGELTESSAALDKAQRNIQQLEKHVEDNRRQQSDMEALLKSERARCDTLAADLEASAAKYTGIEAELKNEQSKHRDVSAEVETERLKTRDLQARLDSALLGSQAESQSLSARVEELQSLLTTERSLKGSELQGLGQRLERAEAELESTRAQRDSDRAERQELQQRLQQLQDAAESDRSLKNVAEDKWQALETRLEEEQRVADQLREKNNDLELRNQEAEQRNSELSAALEEEREQQEKVRQGLQLCSKQLNSHSLSVPVPSLNSTPERTLSLRNSNSEPPEPAVSAGDLAELLNALESCLQDAVGSGGDSAPGQTAEQDAGGEERASRRAVVLAGRVSGRLRLLESSLGEERRQRQELEQRLHAGPVNGTDTGVEDGQPASPRTERQLLSYRRQLEQTERRHQREVSELRRLLALRTSAASVAADANPITEMQYLRNILYEYMMGREQMTLAKVIATVLKFSSEQTASVLEKEQLRHSLLAGSAIESVGSTLSALSPFRWS